MTRRRADEESQGRTQSTVRRPSLEFGRGGQLWGCVRTRQREKLCHWQDGRQAKPRACLGYAVHGPGSGHVCGGEIAGGHALGRVFVHVGGHGRGEKGQTGLCGAMGGRRRS